MALTKSSEFAKNARKNTLKKPKDLPKSPINTGNISPMIAPNVYATRTVAPTPPRVLPSTFGDGGIGPAGNTVLAQVPATMAAAGAAQQNPNFASGARSTLSPASTGGGGGGTSGYTDAALLSGFLGDHPEVAAADTLAGMGITNPEMIDMLSGLMQFAPFMQMLTEGASPGFNTGPQSEAQFILDMAQGLMQPGGSGFDLNSLMSAILNADPNSPLGAYLSNMGPKGVNDLIQTAAALGTSNPLYQRAITNQADASALQYNRDFAHGAPGAADPDAYTQAIRSGWLGRYF